MVGEVEGRMTVLPVHTPFRLQPHSASPAATLLGTNSLKMDVDAVSDLLAEAAELVQMGDYQDAVQKFSEAHQLDPENTTVLDSLAEVLLEIGQVDDAQHISNRQQATPFFFTPFEHSFSPLLGLSDAPYHSAPHTLFAFTTLPPYNAY